MLRILHIVLSLDPNKGGVAKAVDIGVIALKTLNYHNEVVCFDKPSAEFLSTKAYPIYALGPTKTPYSYTSSLKLWARKNIKQYDHIIVHGLWQYPSYAGYRFWKKYASTSSLWIMPHGMLDPYFQKAKERRLKAIRNWFFWKFIERYAVNDSNGLLFTCKEELLLARTTFKPYRPNSENVVGLGVEKPPLNNEIFKDAFYNTLSLLKGRPYILFLGRIDSKKGVDLLIKAYRFLQEKQVGLPDLVIAGPGLESSYGKLVLQEAAELEQIHFPGMLMGNAKWGALYNAECFILPSHQENFGIAVVEALACGTPVLISDQVNIWREIIKEEAGLAAPDTLHGTIELLQNWQNHSKSQKIAKQESALKAYQKYFTTGAFGQNLKALFES